MNKGRLEMGQGNRKKEIRCLVDLNPLPDELLVLILSWVPGRTLVTCCRLVCRRWRDLIDSPTIWKLQLQRDQSKWAVLGAARYIPPMKWSRVAVLQPFGRNLLKNPCGKERFQHWKVQNEGNGWRVEANRNNVEGVEFQTCFASSYSWCSKWQMVNLLEEGLWEDLLDTYQPEIFISDWWGARTDCGCVYSICVRLLAADKRTIIAEFIMKPDPIPQWNDEQYQQVSHVFRRYGSGVRYVHFFHKGKDTQYWAGHYGARVSNSTVLVKALQEPL